MRNDKCFRAGEVAQACSWIKFLTAAVVDPETLYGDAFRPIVDVAKKVCEADFFGPCVSRTSGDVDSQLTY